MGVWGWAPPQDAGRSHGLIATTEVLPMRSANSGTVLAACLLAAALSAGDEDHPRRKLALLAERLSSANKHERSHAALILRESRQATTVALARVLDAHGQQRVGQDGDAAHLAAQALGDWRAEGTSGMLLQRIDYRVRLKRGDKRPPGAAYPCAAALVSIGNLRVLGAVTKALATDGSAKRRKLQAWVIGGLLGEHLGKLHLEEAARKELGEQAARLLAARDDLAKGNLIFRELGE